MSDFDSPWKDALDRWFPAFLAFFFWDIHADIDWTRGHETLDKELQQVVRAAEVGRRYLDKLVKVWLKDGEETWVLIHVEVQSQPDPDFTRRMYVYNYRLFDRYDRAIVSLAALADEQPDWRPTVFRSGRWGSTASLEFRTAKLLDFTNEAVLESDPNPFAVVVLTQRKTQQTRQAAAERQRWKLRLVRSLYERGLTREDVQELFRFIDWMMELPQALDEAFYRAVQEYEEEKHMPYVTGVERRALQRGREEGREAGREAGREEGLREGTLAGLAVGLERKFGARGKRLMARVRRIPELSALQKLQDTLWTVATLEEFRQALP